MDRVDTAIFIETKIQKYIKDMNKICDHSTVIKYMYKAAQLYDILKQNGFRWAPSQGAWQRQLTRNGQWSADIVKKALKAII